MGWVIFFKFLVIPNILLTVKELRMTVTDSSEMEEACFPSVV